RGAHAQRGRARVRCRHRGDPPRGEPAGTRNAKPIAGPGVRCDRRDVGHVDRAPMRGGVGRADPEQFVADVDVHRRAERRHHACVTCALAKRGVRAPAESADAHGGILAVTYDVPMRSRVWAACALLVTGCAGGALTARTESVESFVARHWRMPLAPQGTPPARYTALEASLAPESCGTCHPAQLADWRTSTHASS